MFVNEAFRLSARAEAQPVDCTHGGAGYTRDQQEFGVIEAQKISDGPYAGSLKRWFPMRRCGGRCRQRKRRGRVIVSVRSHVSYVDATNRMLQSAEMLRAMTRRQQQSQTRDSSA